MTDLDMARNDISHTSTCVDNQLNYVLQGEDGGYIKLFPSWTFNEQGCSFWVKVDWAEKEQQIWLSKDDLDFLLHAMRIIRASLEETTA